MRFFTFIIILGASVATIVLFVNPRYAHIKELRAQVRSYDTALQNAEELKREREELQAKYNGIRVEDIHAVETVLPDNVDNIRLIIQMNSIALKTGMSSLRDVNYSTEAKTNVEKSKESELYGEFETSFSTTGSYKNFLNFIASLEQNLRLVDITKVAFEVVEDPTKVDNNKYTVTLKTYWLKN